MPGSAARIVTEGSRLPDASSDRFVRSTAALVSSNATGAVLGVAFWAVAARLYSAKNVGYGVAEIAAMTFVASIALLNLGTVFPRFLYAAGARVRDVLRAGYAASVSVALAAAILFLAFSGHHNFIQPGFASAALFVAAAVLWAVFTIEDAALVGLRATVWVPVENTSFSIGKIILLPVFAVALPRSGVFASWILPVIICVIAVNYYLFRRVVPAHVARANGRGVLPERRVMGTVVLGEYIGGLAFMSMNQLPALIVASRLGSAQAAYFQTPWIAGIAFDMLLFSFATSLIVESTVRPTAATATVRKAVRLATIVLLPGLAIIVIGAPYFLSILGHEYAVKGAPLLRLVALALPFMAVNVLYVTYARLARRVRRVVSIQVSIAAIVLGLTVLFVGHLGIAGVGLAFLIGQAAICVVVFPSVARQYRHPEMTPSYADGATLVAGADDPAASRPTSPPEGSAETDARGDT